MITPLSINGYGSYAYQPKVNNNSHQNNVNEPSYGTISPDDPESRAAQNGIPIANSPDTEKTGEENRKGRGNDNGECESCKNRKYQDGSDDPGVSFKSPTKISADKAASAVRAHEGEHVVRERAEARREGRKVVSQSVTMHSAICPECGDTYISGGTTRTVTKGNSNPEAVAQEDPNEPVKGKYIDMYV